MQPTPQPVTHLHADRDTGETMENVYENFDALFRKLYVQGRQVEELTQRIVELERRLSEYEAESSPLLRIVEPQEAAERIN